MGAGRRLCACFALSAAVCETGNKVPHLPALIFDLDGTLTDSKPGILGCLRTVIEERGMSDHGRDFGPLDRFIGPPVEEWVRELMPGGSEEEHAALARQYRACYDREGWLNNSVFAGVREMLAALNAAGCPLYVCTSKHEPFAKRIMEKFELAQYFTAIYGDKLEYASHAKADLLANILLEHAINGKTAWMIGDRSFDIEAAHANNLRCIAAGWGYGSAEEWADADAVAPTPRDVVALVAGELANAVESRSTKSRGAARPSLNS
jgi:phosphoglycolate phosphatase